MLRYLTAGESHGRALMAILEGLPAGLKVKRKRLTWSCAAGRKAMAGGGADAD